MNYLTSLFDFNYMTHCYVHHRFVTELVRQNFPLKIILVIIIMEQHCSNMWAWEVFQISQILSNVKTTNFIVCVLLVCFIRLNVALNHVYTMYFNVRVVGMIHFHDCYDL